MDYQTIPILRIFDEDKAKEFYLGFLGMNLDWQHRFEDGFPVYMQVSKDNLGHTNKISRLNGFIMV